MGHVDVAFEAEVVGLGVEDELAFPSEERGAAAGKGHRRRFAGLALVFAGGGAVVFQQHPAAGGHADLLDGEVVVDGRVVLEVRRLVDEDQLPAFEGHAGERSAGPLVGVEGLGGEVHPGVGDAGVGQGVGPAEVHGVGGGAGGRSRLGVVVVIVRRSLAEALGHKLQRQRVRPQGGVVGGGGRRGVDVAFEQGGALGVVEGHRFGPDHVEPGRGVGLIGAGAERAGAGRVDRLGLFAEDQVQAGE